MRASDISFGELLNSDKIQYRVPLFQREYIWDEDQWSQLWQDLLEIYDMDKPKKHFIGSVVTQPIPDAPQNVAKHLLIDGQQRMTTLMILLSAIQHRAHQDPKYQFKSSGESFNLSDEIHKTYLINKYITSPEEKTKLVPTNSDMESFQFVIDGNSPSDDTSISRAWRFFSRCIEQGDLDHESINLRKLKDCIVYYLDMVSITLDEADSPNRIFESLNNTGVPLSASDLIRNHFFMNIRDQEKQKEAYNGIWLPMQDRLAGNLDDFFWRYIMMNGTSRKDEVFDEMQNHLGHGPSDSKTIETMQRLHRFSMYYSQIIEPNLADWRESNESVMFHLHRLNEWSVDTARPFLMKALEHMNSEKITPEELAEVIRMIESFVVRRSVCGKPTNSFSKYFTQMSTGVDFTDFIDSSRGFLMRWDWPTDDAFEADLTEFVFYRTSPESRKHTRFVLTSLEVSFDNKEQPAFSDSITIEHIMPQTLTSEWQSRLGPDYEDIHARWLHTIGNLTLTGYNSELGNMPFAEKQVTLANSNFSLSASLQEYSEWNAESIQRRGRELAKRALKIWPR